MVFSGWRRVRNLLLPLGLVVLVGCSKHVTDPKKLFHALVPDTPSVLPEQAVRLVVSPANLTASSYTARLGSQSVSLRRTSDSTLAFLVPEMPAGSYSLTVDDPNLSGTAHLLVLAAPPIADPRAYVSAAYDTLAGNAAREIALRRTGRWISTTFDSSAYQADLAGLLTRITTARAMLAGADSAEARRLALWFAANRPARAGGPGAGASAHRVSRGRYAPVGTASWSAVISETIAATVLFAASTIDPLLIYPAAVLGASAIIDAVDASFGSVVPTSDFDFYYNDPGYSATSDRPAVQPRGASMFGPTTFPKPLILRNGVPTQLVARGMFRTLTASDIPGNPGVQEVADGLSLVADLVDMMNASGVGQIQARPKLLDTVTDSLTEYRSADPSRLFVRNVTLEGGVVQAQAHDSTLTLTVSVAGVSGDIAFTYDLDYGDPFIATRSSTGRWAILTSNAPAPSTPLVPMETLLADRSWDYSGTYYDCGDSTSLGLTGMILYDVIPGVASAHWVRVQTAFGPFVPPLIWCNSAAGFSGLEPGELFAYPTTVGQQLGHVHTIATSVPVSIGPRTYHCIVYEVDEGPQQSARYAFDPCVGLVEVEYFRPDCHGTMSVSLRRVLHSTTGVPGCGGPFTASSRSSRSAWAEPPRALR